MGIMLKGFYPAAGQEQILALTSHQRLHFHLNLFFRSAAVSAQLLQHTCPGATYGLNSVSNKNTVGCMF